MYSTRYSCQSLMKLNFLDRFLKNNQLQNLVKIRPVGAELFHVGGRTDRRKDRHDEAKSRFSHFCGDA
jgi:hypothetical protein